MAEKKIRKRSLENLFYWRRAELFHCGYEMFEGFADDLEILIVVLNVLELSAMFLGGAVLIIFDLVMFRFSGEEALKEGVEPELVGPNREPRRGELG